ncbi:hypothetical protein BOX15_Mlig011629g1 [Macrostomum lignano]|uniref:VWFD domain-containing protein n=1 Tax=Macrostomum lignano TaxID=282301 RepID=A0A267FR15_9PLAT|nr:hypothetical protein BOX15_Mlig011629g1 [Macrostomum lignano]
MISNQRLTLPSASAGFGLLLLALLVLQQLGSASSTAADVKLKETPITGRSGWCIVTLQRREEKNSSCGNMVEMTMEGLTIDKSSVPILTDAALANRTTHEKRQLSLQTYIRDFAYSKATPNCTFYKLTNIEKTQCCVGYDGSNCQTVVCFVDRGGCLNGGKCVKPNVCQCATNYLGTNCDEDLNAIKNNPNEQYCYSDDACLTKKTGFGSSRVAFGRCCSDGTGSFGYQKGCMSCKTSTVAKNNTGVEVVPFDTCVSYGPNSYRTFDGLTFEYQGRCTYLLAGSTNPTMKWWCTITLLNCDKFETCRKQITMRFDDINQYVALGYNVQVFKLSGTTGATTLTANVTLEENSEPNEWNGVKVERKGVNVYLTVRSIGVKLKWDNENSVFVTVDRSLHKNRGLKGLCGDYDGDATNDFGSAPNPAAFGNQWKSESCQDIANVPIHCESPEDQAAAEGDCRPINNVFFQCHSKISPTQVVKRCVQDMCILKKKGETSDSAKSSVLCSHLSAYSYQCSLEGICIDWRGSTMCPQSCPALMTWSECASACPTTCANYDQLKSATCESSMVPRCKCGSGYVHYKSTCIRPNECPCTYNSVEYMPGSNLVVDCSTCNCANGRWQCTYNPNCPKMCSITGSHIVTFDGAKMDFNPMGCAYTLLEPVSGANDSRLQVQVTMEPSPEYLLAVTADSQFVNLPKMITVKYRGVTIQLKSVTLAAGTRPSVIIDGVDFTNSLPYENVRSQILVRQLTSFYAMVKIGNHLSVYFDGYRTVELKGAKLLSQKIEGLCGNFDSKTENDLHTKGSDMIAPPVQVAQSYVSGSCSKTAAELPSPGSTSQSLSGVDDCTQVLLNSDSFKACRDSKKVDILGYYYRFCQKEKACGGIPNIGELYCTAAMSAARACKTAGFQIDFSTDSRLSKCAPSCMSGGGSFTICARTCRSSCSDLSSTSICELGCFPGCDCQYDNQYRDAYGTCVRQSECTCLDRYNRNGKIYRSGAVISRQCTNCTCANGDFACGNSSCADKVVCPKDQVYLDTMPACQKCINYDKCQSNQSESGRCGCPGDLVKKADGSCVAKPHCPCIYLGTEYLPGHILKIGCKTYKCVSRTWTKIAEDATKCEAVCVAYGDPHYSTFDRKAYSFQGSCQYILMKSDANAALGLPPIEVSAQNIPCGSQQVTCTKFVRVKVGSDTYVLVRGREPDQLPVAMNYGMRREKFTLFTQLVSDQLGLRILWDRSTRVYVFVKPHFNSKVSGLCGNFDGNADNDFTIKNLPINNPIEFASNFRTGGDSCASEESSASKSPQSWIEMCTANSRRRDYAESVCGAIKSKTGVFSACQQVLEQDVIENFYENCMYDACGCDTGGDCECVCTVLSAFATTCAESGVSVQWRFQDQCPIMCTGGRVYQPCMPPCAKTCHNVGLEPEPHCVNSQCIEGCACPNGYVEHDNECIPSDNCPCFYQGKEYPKVLSFTIPLAVQPAAAPKAV